MNWPCQDFIKSWEGQSTFTCVHQENEEAARAHFITLRKGLKKTCFLSTFCGGGGSANVGSFGLFNEYLVVFGLFLPKTEEKI